MSLSLPWNLLLAWAGFICFVLVHRVHSRDFRGSSRSYYQALNYSVWLGYFTNLFLLIIYFIQVDWYWPIIIFFLSSAIGGLLCSALENILDGMVLSLISFISWPIFAAWIFFIIKDLPSL